MGRASKALLAASVLLAAGCGYRFTAGGAPLPDGIRHVWAPVFSNRSAEPALEVEFTRAMRSELERAGVAGGPDSDARLEGEIMDVVGFAGYQQWTEVSANGSLQPPTSRPNPVPVYRLQARVRLRLKRGAVVVAETEVVRSEDFLSAQGDVLGTEANRAAALRRLATAMMREGYERLTTGF